MQLFHGSNVAVEKPKILVPARNLDFGAGFYTTSDIGQAEKWAKLQCRRRRQGIASVSVYEMDEIALQKIKVKYFHGPDADWLEFVAQNRKGSYCGEKYDIVIGPVANDNTMPVISDYMAHEIDEKTALLLLAPQRLKDQYAFLTYQGLSVLTYKEVLTYD